MYQVFLCLSTPKSKLFFDRPKQLPIAEFDVLFASGADRALIWIPVALEWLNRRVRRERRVREQRDEYRTMKRGFDITHKSKNATSVPCFVGIFPSFTNHATTCLTVNCSIALEASVAICLSCRKDATKFVKKFSFPRIKFDRPKICCWPRILSFLQNSHQRHL